MTSSNHSSQPATAFGRGLPEKGHGRNSIWFLSLAVAGSFISILFLGTGGHAPPPPMIQVVSTPFLEGQASPTLPPNPGQADLGAQDYWLYCMSCHGDRGQGLTDEFRAAFYPPEDQNCWASGCHGPRPYEGGWTLPDIVPALIGPEALSKFETAAQLHAFIRAAMPFQAPGSLEDETYWRVTAFLLRENGVEVPASLGPENANAVLLRGEPPETEGGNDLFAVLVITGLLLGGAIILGLIVLRLRRS